MTMTDDIRWQQRFHN